MKLTRGNIIYAAVLTSAFAMFGAVYQFYFKEKLAVYAANEKFLNTLEATYKGLQEKFAGYRPEDLIREWRNEQQPWADGVEERARFFNVGDWFNVDTKPQPGEIQRFWYENAVRDRAFKLYQKVPELMGVYDNFPPDIRQNLLIKDISEFGPDADQRAFMMQLRRLEFGAKLAELLMRSHATVIQDIKLWPFRTEPRYGNALRLQSAGLQFQMAPKDLVLFLDKLRTGWDAKEPPRFVTVDALRVVNRCIVCQQEPVFQVEMIVTQAVYNAPPPGEAAGSARNQFQTQVGQQSPAAAAMAAKSQATAPSGGYFDTIMKWVGLK